MLKRICVVGGEGLGKDRKMETYVKWQIKLVTQINSILLFGQKVSSSQVPEETETCVGASNLSFLTTFNTLEEYIF